MKKNPESVMNVRLWSEARYLRPWYECPECHYVTTDSSLMFCHMQECTTPGTYRPHKLRHALTFANVHEELLVCSVCQGFQQFDDHIMQHHEQECTGKAFTSVESMSPYPAFSSVVTKRLAEEQLLRDGTPHQLEKLWARRARQAEILENRCIFAEFDIEKRFGLWNSTLRYVQTAALSTSVSGSQCARDNCTKSSHPDIRWVKRTENAFELYKSHATIWSHSGLVHRAGKRRGPPVGQLLVQHLMPSGPVRLVWLGVHDWSTLGMFRSEIDDTEDADDADSVVKYQAHAVVRSRSLTKIVVLGEFSFVTSPRRGDYVLCDGHRRTRARIN